MHFARLIAWVALSALALPPLFAGATLVGTVPPAERPSEPATQGRYSAKRSGAVEKPEPFEAVVYLEGDFAEVKPPKEPLMMGQRQYQFRPGILVVQKGSEVAFPNEDDDYHNVFSYSKPKRFDLGRYRKTEKPPTEVFDKPGLVKLYCEIHQHMRGTILVVDTPYFGKSDAEGNFRLENLPPGKHTLKVWLDENRVLSQPVELKEGETLKVNLGGL